MPERRVPVDNPGERFEENQEKFDEHVLLEEMQAAGYTSERGFSPDRKLEDLRDDPRTYSLLGHFLDGYGIDGKETVLDVFEWRARFSLYDRKTVIDGTITDILREASRRITMNRQPNG